jgi:CheY-like chemotaxis protein
MHACNPMRLRSGPTAGTPIRDERPDITLNSKTGPPPSSMERGMTRDRNPNGIAGHPKVLIVEDDFLVAMAMELALKEVGVDVVGIARSAEEAEDLAAKHRPKLVVMDIHLAGERDGVDAALAIFRTHGIRSVFATAHQDSHTRHRAEPSAPLGWLSKPYAIDHLTATVRNALAAIDNPG